MTPREYVGNEFHNVPVVHPNHEMDARPAFMHIVGGHWRSLVHLFHIKTWKTPEQYLEVVQHDHPRWTHEVSMAGCGSD